MKRPGSLAIPRTSASMTSGKTRESSTWTRCCTSPAGTCSGMDLEPNAPPTGTRDRLLAGPPAGAAPPVEPGPLSHRREPSDGGPGAARASPRPSGLEWRQPLRAGPLPHGRQPPGGGLLPGSSDRDHVHQAAAEAGGSGAFSPLAVSLQSGTGRATSRSRPRSSPPAGTSMMTGSAAASMAGEGPMADRPSRISAVSGPPRNRTCIRGAFSRATDDRHDEITVQVKTRGPSSWATPQDPGR